MAEIIYGARTRAGLQLDIIGRRQCCIVALPCSEAAPRVYLAWKNSMPSCIETETGATRVENGVCLLWPPCVADADIIFLPYGFFFYLSFFLSSPNLSGRRVDVYCILLHMVWP